MKKIFEAPIQDISFKGDYNTATNFTSSEKKLLKKETYQNRLRYAFKNTPFIFDVVFLMHDKFDANSLIDNKKVMNYISDKKIYNNSLKLHDLEIKANPDAITFVLQGNLSPNNRIPITPWILAHKIGHSLQSTLKEFKSWD